MPRPKERATTARAATEQRLVVPHPDKWYEFAHELDGYRIAEEVGVDLPRLRDQQFEALRTDGRFSCSLLELRLILFFEARASRFVGGLEPAHTTAESARHFYVTDLYEASEFRDAIANLMNAIATVDDDMKQASGPIGDESLQPDALEAGVGGHFGPSYWMTWESGRLVYRAREPAPHDRLREVVPSVRFVRPTKRRWETFWRSLDRLDVWNWDDRYEDPHVLDGTGWNLKIQRGSAMIESGGSNAYPGGHSDSREFGGFLAASRRLLGGLPFS